jgi:hypothetical protein
VYVCTYTHLRFEKHVPQQHSWSDQTTSLVQFSDEDGVFFMIHASERVEMMFTRPIINQEHVFFLSSHSKIMGGDDVIAQTRVRHALQADHAMAAAHKRPVPVLFETCSPVFS